MRKFSNVCKLRQIPSEIGKMKKLKKLTLHDMEKLKFLPEEMGELSSLQELMIRWCEIESLPKGLKDLKISVSISLGNLSKLQLNSEDLVLFSNLKRLAIWDCIKVFTPSFTQSFWEMIKSTIEKRLLQHWRRMDQLLMAEKVMSRMRISSRGTKGITREQGSVLFT